MFYIDYVDKLDSIDNEYYELYKLTEEKLWLNDLAKLV